MRASATRSKFSWRQNSIRMFGMLIMAIVKQLTGLMGGRIAVSSQVVAGSSFTFTLPHMQDDGQTEQYETQPDSLPDKG